MRRRFWISVIVATCSPTVLALPGVRNSLPSLNPTTKAAGRKRPRKKQEGRNDVAPSTTGSITEAQQSTSKLPLNVQAILIPRTFNLQKAIRFACIVLFSISIVGCMQTAGLPHIRAVWDLLQEDDSLKPSMPNGFIPSTLDHFLARALATTYNERLPPLFLPSLRPLLGAIASMFLYAWTTILLPRWFTTAKVYLNYRTLESATPSVLEQQKASVLVHVDDELARSDLSSMDREKRSLVICPLLPSERQTSKQKDFEYCHSFPHYFELNQCRVYFDAESGSCVDGGPSLHRGSLEYLKEAAEKGLSKKKRKVAQQRYGPYNRPELASPTVREAFYARISSPLVVVQIVGKFLTVVEEGPLSIMNLAETLLHHYWNARQAIHSARQLAQDVRETVKEMSSMTVWVLWDSKGKAKWVETSAADVLPGDVFLIAKAGGHEEIVLPVDALLLDGQCLTNEAVLTGESVPQSKVPIDFTEELQGGDTNFDMENHRNSVLFAGSSMIHCSSEVGQMNQRDGHLPPIPKSAHPAVTCLALRTGTYSSKGELLRALKSSSHVGSISNKQSEKDSMRLILCLSGFAAMSCASIFVPRAQEQRSVSAFRRIIQCTRIAVASIPSDLPLALSAVARTCSKALREESDVVCSEPGSLLTAAHVDLVVFDKTGTLTADTQSLSKLEYDVPFSPVTIRPEFQRFLLAGCHSLVHLNNTIVGDPLDIAALRYSSWKFNQDDSSYELTEGKAALVSDPVKLWQIKSFPFDPAKRMSSALVLAQLMNGSYRVWSLTKGSTESLNRMYRHRDDAEFMQSQAERIQHLEARGNRAIALGAHDWTNSTQLTDQLFPEGLSSTKESLQFARSRGAALHRNDFERHASDDEQSPGVDFYGFACFDTAIRPSSKRVIDELRRGGIGSIMLTGDAVDAAIAVSLKVGLIREPSVAILEVDERNDGKKTLVWRIVKVRSEKGSSGSIRPTETRIKVVSKATVKDILKCHRKGKCAIAATGGVVEMVLQESNSQLSPKLKSLLTDVVSSLAVVARATPMMKKAVLSMFKDGCGKKVLMCGDGVNDVAAMKTSDVAVALLNGFGAENEVVRDDMDADDDRRKQKLAKKNIGSNRQKLASQSRKVEKSDSLKAAKHRVNTRIEEAQKEIARRAAARQGIEAVSSNPQYNLADVKYMLSATIRASMDERKRAKQLRVGGGEAARILAEESRNQEGSGDGDDSPMIKPGEASLVASFSCLRPSIAGVDSILRSGIASAACSLSTQQSIALGSLMASYNLATLYRDGFRYGQRMSLIELFAAVAIGQASYVSSCTPRPRLPQSRSFRPVSSLFHPSSVFSTFAQAAIHLASMAVGVNYGNKLESSWTVPVFEGPKLRATKGFHPSKLAKLSDALASKAVTGDEETSGTSIFGRPPFRPNYETNIVFIYSVLQSAVSNLINHKGKPFYGSILENKGLCLTASLTIIFAAACTAETFPFVNHALELRPLPSRRSKLIIFSIAAVDTIACVLCRLISSRFFEKDMHQAQIPRRSRKIIVAADAEEMLLEEESNQNRNMVLLLSCLLAYIVFEMVFAK